jgi:hypothetical protein
MNFTKTFEATVFNRKLNRLLIAFFLLAFTAAAYAETCKMIGGCVGNVWYVHIPKPQIKSKKFFDKAGLPPVNGIATLSTDLSLLDSYAFIHPPYPERLRQDLKRTVEQDGVLGGWGMILQHGSKVRILSYQTFPTLGEMGNELFALVLVITE